VLWVLGRGALALLFVYDVTDADSLAEAQKMAAEYVQVRD
jgi:hypothetical protein